MGGLFGGGAKQSSGGSSAPQIVYMPSTPAIPQYIEAPSDNTAEVKAAAEQQRKASQLAKGRQSTLLTGGMGLEDSGAVNRKSLLGE